MKRQLKNILLLICLVLLFNQAKAQTSKLQVHAGYSLTSWGVFERNNKVVHGYSLGLSYYKPILNHAFIEPFLHFDLKGGGLLGQSMYSDENWVHTWRSHYANLGCAMGYRHAFSKTVELSLFGGLYAGYAMRSLRISKRGDMVDREVYDPVISARDVFDSPALFDFGSVIGARINWNLGKLFLYSEVRYHQGFLEVIPYHPFVNDRFTKAPRNSTFNANIGIGIPLGEK